MDNFFENKIVSRAVKYMLPFLSTFWAIFIMAYWIYYRFHSSYFLESNGISDVSADWLMGIVLPLMSPFIVFIGGYLAILVWLRFIKKIKIFNISLSPFAILIWSFLIMLLLLFIAGYVRLNFPLDGEPALLIENFFQEFPKLVFYSLIAVAGMLLPLAFSTALGMRFFNNLSASSDPLLSLLIKMSLGFFILILLFLFLGIFSILNFPVLIGLLVLLFFITYRQVFDIGRWFFRKVKISFDLSSMSSWFFIFIPSFFLASLIDLIRLVPKDFDSITYYFNRVRLIAESGQLLPNSGGLPFPYELLAAGNRIIFQNPVAGFVYGGIGLVFSLLVLYGLVRYFSKNKKNQDLLLIPLVWLSMNIVYGLSIFQVKPDVFSFSFSVLGLWLFLIWTQDRLKERYLFLALFFLGMSVSIKLVNLIFLAVIFLALIYFWYTWKNPIKKKAGSILLSLIFFLVPLLPWAGLNLWVSLQGSFSEPAKWATLIASNIQYPFQFKITEEQWRSVGIDHNVCAQEATGKKEDFNRYYNSQDNYLKRLVLIPWNLTMNKNSTNLVKEISPMMLIFLPIFIVGSLVMMKKKVSNFSRNEIILLACLGILYWIIWNMIGNGVIWYGLTGFIFFLIPFFLFLVNSYEKWIKIIFGISLVIYLTFAIGGRSVYFAHWSDLQFLVGKMSEAENLNTKDGGHSRIVKRINDDPTIKLWSVGNSSVYYLNNPYEQFHLDQFLDDFNCLYRERDDKLALKRLKSLGINHFFIGKGLMMISMNEETLAKKIQAFEEFAKNNLTLVDSSPIFYLYQIQDEKDE